MTRPDDGIYAGLLQRGVSRRSFIKFSAAMAAALALPASYGPRIAAAVESAPRIPLVWLRGQGCGGDSQAFLQAAKPTVQSILLDLLSVDYFEGLMASSGAAAERSRSSAIDGAANGYIAVVEGSIPYSDGGTACMIGGRPMSEVAREVCAGAIATIAVGSCAFDGGLTAAAGSTTGSVGAEKFAKAGTLITLPGCPVNVDNLTATLVHFLTLRKLPPADGRGRPLFAYGALIHNQCERRAHFEFGEFVLAWGDEAAQKGWCLYKMGCKGPEVFANCPTNQYAEGTSWAVRAGHGCIGCTMPGFWDAMGPAYSRLPPPLPFAPGITVDQIGLGLVGGVGALAAVHGAASWVRGRRTAAPDGHGALAIGEAGALGSSASGAVSVAEWAPVAEPAPATAPSPAAEPAPVAQAATVAEPGPGTEPPVDDGGAVPDPPSEGGSPDPGAER